MNAHIENFKQSLTDPWMISWLVTGALTITIPLISWGTKRAYYYNMYGYAVYAEDMQRQYEEQYNQNNGSGDNNNNGDDYSYASYYKECSWINIACKKRQYYYATMNASNDNGDRVRQQYPDWFLFFGGYDQSEEMQRWKEENTGVRQEEMNRNISGGMKFVYFSELCLFIALMSYGAFCIMKKQNHSNGFIAVLGVSTVIAFTNILMSTQGLISGDEREMEDSYYGWYGKMEVLLVYFNFFIMLFSLGHITASKVYSYLERQKGAKEENYDLEGEGKEYKQPESAGNETFGKTLS